MGRLVIFLLLAALVGGAVYGYFNYQLDIQRDAQGNLQYVMIVPRGQRTDAATVETARPMAVGQAGRSNLRIASFHVDHLDEQKLADPRVANLLVRMIPGFDLLALQGLRARNQGMLVELAEQISRTSGRPFRFAVDDDFGRDPGENQSAFFFDASKIDIDLALANVVQDPAGMFRHKPLVATFRARGPEENQAFTFKLVSVDTDPAHAKKELNLLADLFRRLRGDGSHEDDVIMLGNFGTDYKHFGPLGNLLDFASALTVEPTMLRAGKSVDNIVFDRRATSEFTGRAGVVDLMRQFDLTMREAMAVSSHLPVWAEFSPYEGGANSIVATDSEATLR